MKKYTTGHEKRKLLYTGPAYKEGGLELPQKFGSKISHIEHKKVKEAYFVQCSEDNSLDREQFAKTIRSLGIVVDSYQLYSIFDELCVGNKETGKRINWQSFLQAYLIHRNHKGSFKQVDKAVNLLDHEYNGRWQLLFKDLKELGDVLTQKQLEIFKTQILGDQVIKSDILKNVLLGYK